MLNPIFSKKVQGQKHPGRWGIVEVSIVFADGPVPLLGFMTAAGTVIIKFMYFLWTRMTHFQLIIPSGMIIWFLKKKHKEKFCMRKIFTCGNKYMNSFRLCLSISHWLNWRQPVQYLIHSVWIRYLSRSLPMIAYYTTAMCTDYTEKVGLV